MKTNAPKKVTWMVATVLGVVGVAANVVPIAALAGYSFWMVAGGFALLCLATMLEGL